MRPIKKTEICNAVSRRARYKLCKVVDERFYSVLAGTARDFDAPTLEYENGRVTEAPAFGHADEDTAASGLIYVYENLDDAIQAAGKVGGSDARAHDARVIFKVTPIGFKRPNKKIEGVTLCEAVLVGNEVWRSEPELVWEDITGDVEVNSSYDISYEGDIIADENGADEGFKVEGEPTTGGFKVFKKDC